jgi:hypothetical protein
MNIFQAFKRLFQKVQKGDIVLYDDPNESDPSHRNMLTKVLWVSCWHRTACIRFKSTTMVVSLKHLHVIPVSKFPLQVPEEPKMTIEARYPARGRIMMQQTTTVPADWRIASHGNEAGFASIPLSWFEYAVPRG